MTRRLLAACAVLAVLAFLQPGAIEPVKAQASLDVLEVRPSFFVIAGPGGNAANVGVQVGEDGLVVVDAGSAAGAPGVLAAIRRISNKPIRYVIDTGPDADHVGGN